MATRIAPVLLALLCGCASEVVRHESMLTPVAVPARFVVTERAAFTLESGYQRAINAGTRFVEAGTIPEGRVLKPVGGATFTVEGRHMHEAYPVERAGRLVGFYLPVEKAFSSLLAPISLSLQGDSSQ